MFEQTEGQVTHTTFAYVCKGLQIYFIRFNFFSSLAIIAEVVLVIRKAQRIFLSIIVEGHEYLKKGLELNYPIYNCYLEQPVVDHI